MVLFTRSIEAAISVDRAMEELKDPAFDQHWPAIKNAGIIRGAGHFETDGREAGGQFFCSGD